MLDVDDRVVGERFNARQETSLPDESQSPQTPRRARQPVAFRRQVLEDERPAVGQDDLLESCTRQRLGYIRQRPPRGDRR